MSILKSILTAITVATPTAVAPQPKAITIDADTLVLSGPMTENSVDPLIAKIFGSSRRDMVMYIRSPGGSIDAGNSLIQAMNASGKNFTCVAETAISMAFVTLQLGCQKRVVLDNSTLMQHQASYSLEHAPARNQHNLVEYVEKLINKIEVRQAKRLGLTVEQFKEKTGYDWWLDADDAVKNKAADEVGTAVCSADLASKKHIEERSFFIFTFKGEVSDCPMLSTFKPLPQEEAKADTNNK